MDMGTTINIGQVIARERRRSGITQEELATHLGVSKAAVSKWELSQSYPDVTLLPRIAAFFSLTLDELFSYRARLSDAEAGELYAELYAEGGRDLASAHERLGRIAAERYSDWNLLLMLASLLTGWASLPRDDGEARACDPDELTDEALSLLDRVLDHACDQRTLSLARQQKATTLFQAGDCEGAAALLESIVAAQDAGTAVMLLASCYRRLGRNDDAVRLLQTRRLQAAGLVLSSLMQEVGMRGEAPFARDAAAAALAVHDALGMAGANPLFPVTMESELAETLRGAGERDGALEALGRAVEAVAEARASVAEAGRMPLFDRIADQLDPGSVSEAWSRHKERQTSEALELVGRGLAERAASSEWAELAGDDPRYPAIVEASQRL